MKNSFFLFFFLNAFLISCKENEIRVQYKTLEGTWNIQSIENVSNPFNTNNGVSLFFETCKYTNKNLNAGKHTCIGEIRFNDKKQAFNFKISDNNSFEMSLVNMYQATPLDEYKNLETLFQGVWGYKIVGSSMTIEKQVATTLKPTLKVNKQ